MEQRITRRDALGAAGAVGAALLVGRNGLPALERIVSAAPAAAATRAATVAVTPSMTEGPYWVDELLRRFDVRANTGSSTTVQAGVPLTLKINVLDASGGGAINGAHVDIWHANAYGLYSDESGQQTGGGITNGDTSGQNFLRGYQVTGLDAGVAARSGRRSGELQDDLARLVQRPRDPHPRARPHLRRQLGRDELHDTDLLLRRRQRHRSQRRCALQHALAEDGSDDRRERQRPDELGRRNEHRPRDGKRRRRLRRDLHDRADRRSLERGSRLFDRYVGLGEPRLGKGDKDREERADARPLGSCGREADRAREPRSRRHARSARRQVSSQAVRIRLRVAIPATVVAGVATAKLTLADAAGNTKSLSRIVTVPA